MGNAGGVCCTERVPTAGGRSGDVAKYEIAVAMADIQGLVDLLQSSQPVSIDFNHPWASHPKTVGALAAMQLSVLLSDEKKNPGVKEKLLYMNGIKTLVQFLTDSGDRVHAALLVFAFVVLRDGDVPHKATCAEIHKCGGLPLLVAQLKSPTEGVRFAVADVCAVLCSAKETYKSEFVELGGLKELVSGITGPEDNALLYVDYLEDILADRDGKPVPKYVAAAESAGADNAVRRYLNGTFEAREAVTRVLALMGKK